MNFLRPILSTMNSRLLILFIFLSFSFNQVNILIVGDSDDLSNGLENYQNEVPLLDKDFNISAVGSTEDVCGMNYINQNLIHNLNQKYHFQNRTIKLSSVLVVLHIPLKMLIQLKDHFHLYLN